MSTSEKPTGTFGSPPDERPTGSFAGSVAGLPVEHQLLLNEACDAFEAKWRGKGRPDILAAVLELPEGVRPVALKEFVALDVFYRREGGESPTAAEYAARFPELEPGWLAGVVAGAESPSVGDPTLPTVAGADGAGAVIAGRYTLIGIIGEGGMGSVYRARQSEPVRRDVALKLIKVGLDSKTVLARFDAERQALALMDHPSIARVYDGGTTAAGQPFFVMELVRGVPITQFCDARRLPIAARLELFVQVCQAVQHAHQKGIIHRDLKPGNVLVTEVDGRPTPKVIDFGVAKATEQRLTDLSLADTGAIVGTPAYMSPEQADPTSIDIDTRTDVYALGVILYELLTGSPPHDVSWLMRGAILEMLRMVREVEPPRPSTKLSTSDALPNIAVNRDIDPAKLAKLLRGELDWVVMKALEKDRDRRYGTALAFAQDVQRYLADEVVEARPPGRGYRLKKFVRRNKVQVIAATLILLVLIGGVVGTSLAMVEARREAGRADREAGEARRLTEAQKKAVALALENEGKARRSEADARDNEAKAKANEARARWNERLARDANHAIKIDLAVRAQELKDWGLVRELLDETHADFGRTFENRLVRALWVRKASPVQILAGHTDFVTGVAFSRDGTRVASGSWDRTARIRSAETGTLDVVLKGHTGRVTGVAFGPGGNRVVTGSWDRTARVWDAATGAERLVLRGHSHYVLCVTFSPDGKRIATGGYDNTLRIWDAETGDERLAIPEMPGPVWSLAFDPRGTQLVAAAGSVAQIRDAETGKELHALRHIESVTGVAFSPEGTRVATVGNDRTGRVWDAATGAELFSLKGHTSWLTGVAFSPDGSRIVTGGHDKVVRVWDTETGGEKLALTGPTESVTGVAFSPDGLRVAAGSWDQTVRVWSAESITEKHVLLGHTSAINAVAISADGTRIATASGSRRGFPSAETAFEVKVWNAETGKEAVVLHGSWSEPVVSLAFSPDGTRLVTGGTDDERFGEVKVWDLTTGKELFAFRVARHGFRAVAFSPDGKRLLTWGEETQVWDAGTGAEVTPRRPGARVVAAAFSPDGRRVITSEGEYEKPSRVTVWDVASGKELADLPGHTGMIRLGFSPDGKRIATAGVLQPLRLWDAGTYALRLAVPVRGDVWIEPWGFSPDGRYFRIPGHRVLDAETGAETHRFTPPPTAALAKGWTFSPDWKWSTASDSRRLWFWEVGNATEPLALVVEDSLRYQNIGFEFSPDGRYFVTFHGAAIRVWDTAELKRQATSGSATPPKQ